MAKKQKQPKFSNEVRIQNRKARFDYEVLETYEAGIELTGCEVKSLRLGTASLVDTYATPRGEQLFVRGMHIKPYEQGPLETPDPTRERRLLLHRREIGRLIGLTSQKGYTLVPLQLYFNDRGWAKVKLGVCQGKKAHDKRETIKRRDMEREMRREYKTR